MASLATRRLIEASATLEPADRALLNLWVNRGLADERLTGLTGLSPEALGARRRRIVAGLASELGLPETDVRDALTAITPGREALTAPSATNGHAPVIEPDPQAEPEPEAEAEAQAEAGPQPVPQPQPQPEAEAGAAPRRHAARWLSLAVLVVAAVVVVLLATGGSSSPRRAARRQPTTSAAPTTSPAPTTPAPRAAPHGPTPEPLLGLPGGLAHTTGSVRLAGPVKHLRLELRVTGLPAPHRGHYEVWLYDSVLNSQPLARLREGRHALTIHLPRSARRYRWIDISFQPLGTVYHSGESVLRAANPAHGARAKLRKRSTRRRRRLRPAASVPTTTTHSTPRAARHKRAASRAHRRRRRVAKGSKKAITS